MEGCFGGEVGGKIWMRVLVFHFLQGGGVGCEAFSLGFLRYRAPSLLVHCYFHLVRVHFLSVNFGFPFGFLHRRWRL